MTRTAFVIIVIFALLFSSVELVKMAKANAVPIFWTMFYSNYDEVEPVPSTIPPSISMYSPQNNTVYSSRNITVSLYVRNAELAGWQSSVTNVYYTLDGKSGAGLYFHPINERLPAFNTTFNLPLVSLGKHQLTVEAYVDVLRSTPSEVFFLETNSTVYFTVDLSGESPTPAPTIAPTSMPTSTPGPTSTPSNELQLTGQEAIFGVAFTITVVCVGLGLLVYLIKRK
jgi:hypothetical protein